MKTLGAVLVILVSVVVLTSCPMPSMTSDQDSPGDTPPDNTPVTPVVVTDTARNIAVFIDEDGTRTDVAAEEPDGAVAACTEAFTLSLVDPVPDPGVAASLIGSAAGIRAIVTGRRGDGALGIWVILTDRTVTPALSEAGVPGCRLPESGDRDGALRGWWGWTYTITGSASNGGTTIVVGDAMHEKGISRGPWTIDPGTTVGVYWKIVLKPGWRHAVVYPARVIGTLDPENFPPHWGWWPRGFDRFHHHRRRLARLKLFFLGWYNAYLGSTVKDGTSWDPARGLFVVEGIDQDGVEAEATIDPAGPITITQVGPPQDKPDLQVASLSVPEGVVRKTDTLPLEAVIRNDGPGSAAASSVAFFLSLDSSLDPAADTPIGTVPVPALASGEEAAVSWTDGFSVGTSGTHWVFAVAESGFAEVDASNNTASAAVRVFYDRIVVDTYRPMALVNAANTFASLFGPAGDPTLETGLALWNDDVFPYTVDAPPVSIAEADAGNPSHTGCARIDYGGELAPGTYYVRVRGQKSTSDGVYAIRVLLAPDASYTSWYFGEISDDAENEIDDDPRSGGVPTDAVPIAIGGRANRALTAGDVDWLELTLP